jgi:pyruvate dehydrogenase (quinone)
VNAYTRNVDKHTPIQPEYVASVLDEEAADNAVFIVDTGMCVGGALSDPKGRRRILGSCVHGSMADALPQAIGAQFLDRGRQVVLPPHATSYLHTFYSAIATNSRRAASWWRDPAGCARPSPIRCPRSSTSSPGPTAPAGPPKITTEQIGGFAMSASRAVLIGGVGRTVHLAKADLRSIPRP